MKTFTVTTEHLKLLRRFEVGWQDCEYGAPEIDPKRPYGNSSVEYDILEILEVPFADPEEEEYSKSQRERAATLHREMETVLQICVRNLGVKMGAYQLKEDYGNDWELRP